MHPTKIVEALATQGSVKVRLAGNSMQPIIESKQLVTIEAVNSLDEIKVGDAVYCKVHGRYFLHLVTAKKDGQVQISNNKGHVNGWVTIKNIFGKMINIEP